MRIVQRRGAGVAGQHAEGHSGVMSRKVSMMVVVKEEEEEEEVCVCVCVCVWERW